MDRIAEQMDLAFFELARGEVSSARRFGDVYAVFFQRLQIAAQRRPGKDEPAFPFQQGADLFHAQRMSAGAEPAKDMI